MSQGYYASNLLQQVTICIVLLWKGDHESAYSFLHNDLFCIIMHILSPHYMPRYKQSFIKYTFLVLGRTFLCPQNSLTDLWHGFDKVLETFLRDSGPCSRYRIKQLLQIFRLCIHAVNLPFHHTPMVLYLIEIWSLCRLDRCTVGDDRR